MVSMNGSSITRGTCSNIFTNKKTHFKNYATLVFAHVHVCTYKQNKICL